MSVHNGWSHQEDMQEWEEVASNLRSWNLRAGWDSEQRLAEYSFPLWSESRKLLGKISVLNQGLLDHKQDSTMAIVKPALADATIPRAQSKQMQLNGILPVQCCWLVICWVVPHKSQPLQHVLGWPVGLFLTVPPRAITGWTGIFSVFFWGYHVLFQAEMRFFGRNLGVCRFPQQIFIEHILYARHQVFCSKRDIKSHQSQFLFLKKKMFWPHHTGMWDLSSPTRDQTHIPCIGSAES